MGEVPGKLNIQPRTQPLICFCVGCGLGS